MASTRATWLRNGSAIARRLPWWSTDVGPWLYVLASLCLISLLAFFHLGQASYVVGQIEEMERLENTIYDLKRQNNAKRLEIAEEEQMPRIKERARALGFAEPEHIEYLEVMVDEPYLSPRGSTEHDTRPPPPVPPPVLPAWWQLALGQFTDWVRVGMAPLGRQVRQ